AITAIAARGAPMSCCPAAPIPRRTRPTSTPRAAPSSAGAPSSRRATRARIGPSCARFPTRWAAGCRTIHWRSCASGSRQRARSSRRSTRSCRRNGAPLARRACSRPSLSPIRSAISTAPTRWAAPRRPWRNAPRRTRRPPPTRGRPAPMGEFFTGYVWPTAITVVEVLVIVVPLLLAVAYLTYAERKVLAAAQLRKGPNVVGAFGLLQPLADGAKLLFKETVIPSGANRVVFVAAPILTFVLSLIAWAVIPFDAGVVISNINVGVLYLFAISSLGVYGIIMAGWSSNSKYAFLGGLRSAAQMVSYEVSIGFVIVSVLLCVGSLNLSQIVEAQSGAWGALGWYWLRLFPMFIVFFISALAETNRSPFDLPEGESELVAGFFVEYSAMTFALFYLGEYANMILMSAMTSVLFLGGWLSPVPFALKIAFVLFCFLWVRATFPRFRYDQLMRLGWKVFLPLSLGWLVLTAGVLVATGTLPQ